MRGTRPIKDDRGLVVILGVGVRGAVGVTAFGIVGLTSYWVAQRRRQIGIRRALGATPASHRALFPNRESPDRRRRRGVGIALAMAAESVDGQQLRDAAAATSATPSWAPLWCCCSVSWRCSGRPSRRRRFHRHWRRAADDNRCQHPITFDPCARTGHRRQSRRGPGPGAAVRPARNPHARRRYSPEQGLALLGARARRPGHRGHEFQRRHHLRGGRHGAVPRAAGRSSPICR